jgi:hypothetical protein
VNTQSNNWGTRSVGALVLGLSLGAVVPQAQAVMLYEQAPRDAGVGFLSSIVQGSQSADSFSLGNGASANRLSWWGSFVEDDEDSFTVRIFGDGGGGPGSPFLHEFAPADVTGAPEAGILDFNGQEVFRYTFNFPNPVVLNAATYFVAISSESDDFEWYWQEGLGGDSENWFRMTDTDSWTPGSSVNQAGDLAFRIEGERITQVPEPETLSLLAFSLGGLLVARARRAKRNLAVGCEPSQY